MSKRNGVIRAFAVLVGLWLSACASPFNGPEHALTPAERHPISVDPDIVTLSLPVGRETIALPADYKAKVRQFVAGYKERGHGPVTVATPSGSPNDKMAINAASGVAETMVEAGLNRDQIHMASYRASHEHGEAPVVLSYVRYVATAGSCGNWSEGYTSDQRNLSHPNFGCASQHNLAAMVADPHDLIGPRSITPADASRRDKVLEQYREGEVTATKRSEEETGTVSEVNR